MSKISDIQRPALAILAGPAGGLAQYLSQIARLAGWRVEEEGASPTPPKASVRIEDNHLIFFSQGMETRIGLPAQGAKIILTLQALNRGISHPADAIPIGQYSLLPQDFLLLDAEGQGVRLTEKETSILVCLSRAGGKAVSRQALLDDVWAYAEGVETHTLETHIYRLRQKIEKDPAKPECLLTLEDGYALAL